MLLAQFGRPYLEVRIKRALALRFRGVLGQVGARRIVKGSVG
jgi:hypothetical protein